MNKRTQYTREFKLEAVKLLDSGQQATTELVQELGIQRSVLYRWRDEYAEHGEQAFLWALVGANPVCCPMIKPITKPCNAEEKGGAALDGAALDTHPLCRTRYR